MLDQRRDFLKATSAGAIALAMNDQTVRAAANEQLTVAVIGPGGMGTSHTNLLAARKDVRVKYVCDVDQQRLAKAAEAVRSTSGKAPEQVGDMRRVFDDKEVDAVFIATPDHWHAPASILALDAGKHVYVEKPCCHNIREGRLMADAVARSGKCLQVGTQSRSTRVIEEAMQRLHAGEIGEILVAKAWNSQRRGSIGKQQPSAPPAYLDFDSWVGPAPLVPYRSNLLHGVWRWWYDFGCGDMGNDGVHDIDVALWGLGVDTHPSSATCMGGKYFFDDDQQFPDTQYAAFEYPVDGDPKGRKKQLIFEQRIWSPYVQEGYENGAAFYGTNGVMILGHTQGWKMYGPRMKLLAENAGPVELPRHHTNFLDCIRGTQTKLNADIKAGQLAAGIVHLANIAARVGSVLQFDPVKEQITNHADANALVRRQYRDGHWAVPVGVA
ncbi:MAG: Gfo/Idh/MocA family oxidoreductase [Planctomycetaceae bacterium]|nr:Gfo/Idh/MocA family oxidoreductase [Planctomycetales bacterium]MCB9940318.1 Gfo/Idh/MocA family oxidoreductase [Planctomycetaceae bacterium]